ncbi:MAG: TonB-dependent receptor [Planctomycetes bacterium]|jgi:outer membrane cobalamin receptor|nr:TonB-dependent receptor [Planctomycetota bacterium]
MRTTLLIGLLFGLTLSAVATGEPTVVPETTVTATRTPRDLSTLSGTAEVLDLEDTRLRDAWTLEEAVREMNGVDVVGHSRYGQEVRLNTRGVTSGYGTQRTLVLLDGRPVTDEYLGNVDLAQYPLFAMERVELVRGPASSLYGTNALGGVVNLIPRRGRETPLTEIFAEGGSFGTRRGGFAHGRMIGPVDVFVAGDAMDTDGYLNNGRGDDMDWQTFSGFVNVGYEEDLFGLRAILGTMTGEGTDEDFDRVLSRDMQDLSFVRRPEAGSPDETRVRLYRSGLDQTLRWFERPETDFRQSSIGAILSQSYRIHSAHLLTGGLEWRREDARVKEAAGPVDEAAAVWSGFLQDEIDATEDLRFVVGMRYDDRTGIDGEASFRAGANWLVADGTVLRAAVGKAFRAPTISDQYLPPTSYYGMTFAGNPDLDPETLFSAEAGVDQRISEWLSGSVTAFLSKFEDFWDFLPDDEGVFRPQNIARVRIFGVETLFDADLGEGLVAQAGYTFTSAKYVDFTGRPEVEGNRLDDNVRHRGSASLVWRHADGHAVRLSILASGNRTTDPENSGEGRLDGFYVVSLSGEARLTEWAVLFVNVENALNHGHRTRPEYREPPRAIFAGLRVSF